MVRAVDSVFRTSNWRLPVELPPGPLKLPVEAVPETNSMGAAVPPQFAVSTVVDRDAVPVNCDPEAATTVNDTVSGGESQVTDTEVVSVSPGPSVACVFDSDPAVSRVTATVVVRSRRFVTVTSRLLDPAVTLAATSRPTSPFASSATAAVELRERVPLVNAVEGAVTTPPAVATMTRATRTSGREVRPRDRERRLIDALQGGA
jgi:hypothetical protein